MGMQRTSKCKACARSVFLFFTVAARRMLVADFLLVALVLVGQALLVTVGQGVEGLDPAAFGQPFLLTGDGALPGVSWLGLK